MSRDQGGVGLCMTEYPECAPDFDEIDRLAEQALGIIPAPLRQHLDGILIRVAEIPSEEIQCKLRLESPYELLGL